MIAILTTEEALVLSLVERLAAAGAPAPSNVAIATEFDFPNPDRSRLRLRALERKRAIRVEYVGARRRVTIVATETATALSEPGRRGPDRIARLKPEEAPLPAPVDRDPCFNCGVRRDLGCHHQPRGC